MKRSISWLKQAESFSQEQASKAISMALAFLKAARLEVLQE